MDRAMKYGTDFSWKSRAGREVTRRLEAWGLRELEVKATGGHRGALPSASGGGGRGKPGDLPGVWHLAQDIDMSLLELFTRAELEKGTRLVGLLWFCFRDCDFATVGKVCYVMSDDSEIVLPAGAEPPAQNWKEMRTETREVRKFDLDEFADPALDAIISSYHCPRGRVFKAKRIEFLRGMLLSFGHHVASSRGLGDYGRYVA